MMRMRLVIAAVSTMIVTTSVCAQQRIGADTVLLLMPGSGQNSGQGPVFFPRNIIGLPDSTASAERPVTDPRSICSIGLGGEIILGFSGHAVVDRPGADFVVYENAFTYGGGRIYAEPAAVSVSADGVTWTPFTCHAATLRGCAGVTPTDASLVYGGGDAFDLADVGVDSVRWVRIVDITQRILDDPSHRFFDPTLSGFDLDAVVALHSVRIVDAPQMRFDPAGERFEVGLPAATTGVMRVFDVRGTMLDERQMSAGISIVDATAFPPGLLIVQVITPSSMYVTRVLR